MFDIMSKDAQNYKSFHIKVTIKLAGKLVSTLLQSHFLEACVLGRVRHFTLICYILCCDIDDFFLADIDEKKLAASLNSI